MERILEECDALSAEQRLAYPVNGVQRRIHEVVERALHSWFQDWTLEICFLLDHQPNLRYGQLKDLLPRISTRTLASKLRHLQEAGLVARVAYDEIPPRVEYHLTSRGRDVTNLLMPLLVHASTGGAMR